MLWNMEASAVLLGALLPYLVVVLVVLVYKLPPPPKLGPN